MRDDICPGATFPDYELPDHEGTPTRLSTLQGSLPMILHLSRGSYCPREHRWLRGLVSMWPEFRVAFTRVCVISAYDNQLEVNEFRDQLGAEFPFLTDNERSIAKDLGIQEYTDPVHDGMVPHTFVLEPGLKIHSQYNGYWFWGRPSAHELHVDLREVTRKWRADFDLHAPGLREAWDRKDHAPFLVEPPVGKPIRYTEGDHIGVKR